MWNLTCADGEFDISFHPPGFASGYPQLAAGAHRLRVGDVDVVVADLADVIHSKESAGRPKDLQVLPLLYRHQAARNTEREARTLSNHTPERCHRRNGPNLGTTPARHPEHPSLATPARVIDRQVSPADPQASVSFTARLAAAAGRQPAFRFAAAGRHASRMSNGSTTVCQSPSV